MKEFKEVKVLYSQPVEYDKFRLKAEGKELYTLEELERSILIQEKDIYYVKALCRHYEDSLYYGVNQIVWLETMMLPDILLNKNHNIHLDKPYYWEKGDIIRFDFYPVINDRCIDKDGVVKRILGYSIKFNCEKY